MFQLFRNIKHFVKNLWAFRKQLWDFRRYDYGCNLKMLNRSLELTAEYMRSDDAMMDRSIESAGQIDIYLALMNEHEKSIEVAEKELGLSTFSDDREDVRKISDLALKIEEDRWNVAFDYLKNNMRNWWD